MLYMKFKPYQTWKTSVHFQMRIINVVNNHVIIKHNIQLVITSLCCNNLTQPMAHNQCRLGRLCYRLFNMVFLYVYFRGLTFLTINATAYLTTTAIWSRPCKKVRRTMPSWNDIFHFLSNFFHTGEYNGEFRFAGKKAPILHFIVAFSLVRTGAIHNCLCK